MPVVRSAPAQILHPVVANVKSWQRVKLLHVPQNVLEGYTPTCSHKGIHVYASPLNLCLIWRVLHCGSLCCLQYIEAQLAASGTLETRLLQLV